MKNDLAGVWTLMKFIIHREIGEGFVWPGKQSGALVYTENGYVSVARNREPLPDPTPENRPRVSNFYTGTYELDLQHDRLIHTALQSSVSSSIGVPAERHARLDSDDRLRLSGIGLKEKPPWSGEKWILARLKSIFNFDFYLALGQRSYGRDVNSLYVHNRACHASSKLGQERAGANFSIPDIPISGKAPP